MEKKNKDEYTASFTLVSQTVLYWESKIPGLTSPEIQDSLNFLSKSKFRLTGGDQGSFLSLISGEKHVKAHTSTYRGLY